jgi:hypothetical protein
MTSYQCRARSRMRPESRLTIDHARPSYDHSLPRGEHVRARSTMLLQTSTSPIRPDPSESSLSLMFNLNEEVFRTADWASNMMFPTSALGSDRRSGDKTVIAVNVVDGTPFLDEVRF